MLFKKNKMLGWMFSLTHVLFILLILFLIIFSNNLIILGYVSFLLIIIICFNYIFDDCPITLLEEYHLGYSVFDKTNSLYPIKYDKKRRPEVTLQWIFMGILFVMVKILFLLFFKTIKYLNLCNIKGFI